MVNQNNKRGLTLIVLVFMILVTVTLIVVAYGFLIIHEMRSSGIALSEESALYVAETGIERAMEYLKNDTDWSDNNGTSIINENFGVGSYSVDFSGGTRTNTVVTSTGTVGAGPNQVQRRIRQGIRRLPEAFNYALFWEALELSYPAKVRDTVNVNGGDVFTKGTVRTEWRGRFNVANGGTPSTTSGGFVYTTKRWKARGNYTVGITPGDLPSSPVLDTTFYDNEIATAEAQLPGDINWVGGSQNLSGTTYVNGKITINGTAITGKGALVATGDITVQGSSTITPDSGGFIRLISKSMVMISDGSTTATSTLAYGRLGVWLDKVTVTGAFISPEYVGLLSTTVVKGYIYCDYALLWLGGTINGSIVVNRHFAAFVLANVEPVTFNYDQSYLEEAAPGLGLDIDGDGNNEGVIIKVPGTWQELGL